MLQQQNNLNKGSNYLEYMGRKIPYPYIHYNNLVVDIYNLVLNGDNIDEIMKGKKIIITIGIILCVCCVCYIQNCVNICR